MGEPVTPCVCMQNARFPWARKKVGFVQPLVILLAYRSFPMWTNWDKCCLLLIEDPALEAQPRHEVAVGVGRHLSPGHDIVGPIARPIADAIDCNLNYFANSFPQTVHALSARLCKMRHYTNAVCCSLKIPWVQRQLYRTNNEVLCGIVRYCCVVVCNPLAMGDCRYTVVVRL